MVPRVRGDSGVADDWMVLAERTRAAWALLKVGCQLAAGDTEEVVHIDVAALGLCSALRHQRDRRGRVLQAAGACAGRDAAACPVEPGLQGKVRSPEGWSRPERHVLGRPVELKSIVDRRGRRERIAGHPRRARDRCSVPTAERRAKRHVLVRAVEIERRSGVSGAGLPPRRD